MLRQDELAFIKAISTLQMLPALLKELKLAMALRKKKPVVPAGKRSTTSSSGARDSQKLVGKHKANEVACSGESMEPANRRPAPGAGSVPLPANLSVTGEQAAVGSRQPGPSGGGATYTAVLAGPIAPSKTSGTLKPTTMDSDPSESGVSPGPLRSMPDGTISKAQVCLPARERPNKTSHFYFRC